MKDHQKRELVDNLTKAARDYFGTEQLRARIAEVLLPALDADSDTSSEIRDRLSEAQSLAADECAKNSALERELQEYREFASAAVHALRKHVRCGDAHPENGWPEVNAALAAYETIRRRADSVANRSLFNSSGFIKEFERVVRLRGKTMKEVSNETGVSETTLSRMMNNTRLCDAASMVALCSWSGIDATRFFNKDAPAMRIRRIASIEEARLRESHKKITGRKEADD